LDDELESLRIKAIATLAKEKASIKGLFQECLALSVNSYSELVCKPVNIFDFLKSYPSGISS
jgi:hypothetical protein